MDLVKRFVKDEQGLETVEWAFVLGFVVLIAVLAFAGSRQYLTSIFGEMQNELESAADLP